MRNIAAAESAVVRETRTVEQIVGAVLLEDIDQIELDRPLAKSDDLLLEIISCWSPELPWRIKSGFIQLLMDRDTGVNEIMENGLDSPLPEDRAAALSYLSDIPFDELYNSTPIVELDREISKWKHDNQNNRFNELKLALHDAIRLPMGVIPVTATQFVSDMELEAAELRRHKGQYT